MGYYGRHRARGATLPQSAAATPTTPRQIATITKTLLPYADVARPFGPWPAADVTEAILWAYKTAREIKTVVLNKEAKATRRSTGGVVTVNRDVQLLRRAFNWATAALPADVRSSPFPAGGPPRAS